MKKIITLILALAMALSLVACGGQTAPAEPETPDPEQNASDGPVEVLWWTSFGESNVKLLQKVIDAYNESQDAYHVTIEYQGKQAELNAKLQSTSQADLPAIFSGPVENVAMYANSEYCTPLQGFIDADSQGWPELESTWEAIRTAYCDNDGNQVGYPIGYSYPGIYYNKDMLAEAGIDPNEIQSMNDLYDASAKLVKGGFTTYGVGFHPDGFYVNAALGREGIQAYNNNNGIGSERITECLYTSDATVHDAMANMLGVYQKLHAEKLCAPYGSDYQDEIIPQMASGE